MSVRNNDEKTNENGLTYDIDNISSQNRVFLLLLWERILIS